MVFYVVVGAAWEHFCYFCPFIAVLLVGLEHHFLLFWRPLLFVYGWIEVIVPSAFKDGYLSLHCLPLRESIPYLVDIFSLISAQFLMPYLLTRAKMALSS